ncbi:hypothetical protein AALC25_14460 [Lachnospiraceae bacterium 29-84]
MKEKIENEILKRYEILFGQGLFTDAKDWVRDGKVLISSTLQNENLSGESNLWGILFTLDEKPEYAPYVEEIESERNVKVFMGIVTHTTVGTLLSLMFVAAEESEWEFEKDFMKEEQVHYAFVFNIEEERYELGSIRYEVMGGGLVRSE